MKKLPLVVVVGAAATAAAYLAWQPGVPDDPLPDRGTAASAEASLSVAPSADRAPGADATAADAAADTAPDAVVDTAAEPACTVVSRYLPRGDGTAIEVVSCEPEVPAAQHPYASYPSEALESLAYSDATAARMLGMRLIEDDATASLSLAVRAAALSGGDPAPIVAYSNAYPHPVFVNGVPQRKTVHVKYVLDAVAALLDDNPVAPNQWEMLIREHSADPDSELAMLQARAQAIVAEMRRIQRDVSGTSTLGGPGDA